MMVDAPSSPDCEPPSIGGVSSAGAGNLGVSWGSIRFTGQQAHVAWHVGLCNLLGGLGFGWFWDDLGCDMLLLQCPVMPCNTL